MPSTVPGSTVRNKATRCLEALDGFAAEAGATCGDGTGADGRGRSWPMICGQLESRNSGGARPLQPWIKRSHSAAWIEGGCVLQTFAFVFP